MTPKITILMPVYNGEKTVESAVRSMLEQTCKDFEFLIINDGSTDRSRHMLERLAETDSRITLISRENRGLIASLNEGLDRARGAFIARMDCDDLSLPHRLERQFALMEAGQLDICGGHFLVIDDHGKACNAVLTPIHPDMLPVWLAVGTPFAHGSVMIRASFLKRTGLRYDREDSAANEDMALWMKCYEQGARLGNVDEVIFKYRWYPESFSHTKLRTMKTENIRLSKRFFATHGDRLTGHFQALLQDMAGLSTSEKAFLVKSAFSFLMFQRSGLYFRIAARVGPQITLVNTLGQLNLILGYWRHSRM